MLNAFIVIYLIFYFILSFKHLDWAVMLMLVALPSYQIRFSVSGYPSTLLEAMIVIASVVWVARNYRQIINNAKSRFKAFRNSTLDARRSTLSRYPFDLEIILMLLISWSAIIAAGVTSEALGIWKAYFYEPALVFILVMNVLGSQEVPSDGPRILRGGTLQGGVGDDVTVTTPEEKLNFGYPKLSFLEKILWPLAISAFVVSSIAIFQKFTGLLAVPAFWPRVTGPFPYPNALGLYLGPLVLIMTGWLFHLLSFRAPSGLGGRNPLKNSTGVNNGFSNDKQEAQPQLFSKFVASFEGFLGRCDRPRNDTKRIVFLLITITLSSLSIFFARSEGAIAGVAMAALFFLGFAVSTKIFKNRWMMKIGVAKLFIIIFLAFGFPFIALKIVPAHYYPHFDNKIIDYALNKIMLNDLSGEIRKQQWRETWTMMTASPARFIFGTGLSGYREAVAPYHQAGIFFNKEHDPDFRRKIVLFDEKYKAAHWQPVEIYMYPHSLVLNFWTELGLAGAILFLWIIIKFLYIMSYELRARLPDGQVTSYKKSCIEYLNLGLLGAMIVVIIHGIVDVPYFKNDLGMMFWVLVAMAGMMDLRTKSEAYQPATPDDKNENKR